MLDCTFNQVSEGVNSEGDSSEAFLDVCLHVNQALVQLGVLRLLVLWLSFGVYLDDQQVLVSFELLSDFITQLVIVFKNSLELGSSHECFSVFTNALKSGPHDGNHHVEDDEQRHDSRNQKDDPEDKLVLEVFLEVACKVKISERKPVRVNDTEQNTTPAFVASLSRVLVNSPEHESLSQHDEAKHTCQGHHVIDDFLHLASEHCEKVKDSDSQEQFERVEQDNQNHEIS